jgi:flagellar secretion chaperone FliS
MPINPHDAYLESRILTADPLELVRMMYQAAIGEVRSARLHLQNRDIRSRSNAITKACSILTELTVSLDRKTGGEYAERLCELYGYIMNKLSEANFKQRDEPMAEALDLLNTLLDGWEGAQRQLQSAPERASQPIPAAAAWAHADEVSYTPQAWSF